MARKSSSNTCTKRLVRASCANTTTTIAEASEASQYAAVISTDGTTATAGLKRTTANNMLFMQKPGHKVTSCPQTLCYACQKYGHIATACPLKRNRKCYCYRCGYPGVIVRDCPQYNPVPHNSENQTTGGQKALFSSRV